MLISLINEAGKPLEHDFKDLSQYGPLLELLSHYDFKVRMWSSQSLVAMAGDKY